MYMSLLTVMLNNCDTSFYKLNNFNHVVKILHSKQFTVHTIICISYYLRQRLHQAGDLINYLSKTDYRI